MLVCVISICLTVLLLQDILRSHRRAQTIVLGLPILGYARLRDLNMSYSTVTAGQTEVSQTSTNDCSVVLGLPILGYARLRDLNMSYSTVTAGHTEVSQTSTNDCFGLCSSVTDCVLYPADWVLYPADWVLYPLFVIFHRSYQSASAGSFDLYVAEKAKQYRPDQFGNFLF
jgi:hypothetical protein